MLNHINNKKSLFFVIIITLLTSFIFSNSRIAFSRPNSFLRTPSLPASSQVNRFIIGTSGEFINTTNLNYARSLHLHALTKSGFDYGFNYLTHADVKNTDLDVPSEFLFNFTKEIYRFNKLIINLGVHDIPLSTDIKDSDPSVFLSFITDNIELSRKYFLQTAVGVGSGRINKDSHNYNLTSNHANLFMGVQLKTPWKAFKKETSVSLMFEYADGGFHMGADLPINKNLKMQFALTHIENFYKFNDYKTNSTEEIHGDDSGIAISFQYAIPTKENQYNEEILNLESVSVSEPENNCYIGLIEANKLNPLIINDDCTVSSIKQIVKDINGRFHSLNDSLLLLNQTLTAHDLTNNYLEIKVASLEDSLKTSLINNKISKTELNIAIKSLTNSLKYYYSNEYHLALKELDKTIQYLPNLAVAYARRGSIYYKLGDIDRATLSWNYALQLDPEYKEVKNILQNLNGDRMNNLKNKLPE